MRKLLSLLLSLAMMISVMATAAAADIQLSDAKISTASKKDSPFAFAVDSDARYTEVSGGYVFYTYTPAPPAIPVTGVTLDTTELSLSVGEEYTLTASVSPDNADIPDVIWSSDNESVARVDSNGTVTAVAEGEAEITVTTVDGGFSDVCVVTVTDDGSTPTPPTPTPPPTEYELGDVNMDNKVDTGDAAMVLRYSVELVEFDEYQLILADYNSDNKVDTGDAAGILRAAVGLR